MRCGLSRSIGLLCAIALMLCGCGGSKESFGWPTEKNYQPAGMNAFVFQWAKRLVPAVDGPYSPVELSGPVLDPEHNRVYVGTSAGKLWALNGGGGKVFHYDAAAAIHCTPALDVEKQELYVGTEDAIVHALAADTGILRWRKKVAGPVNQQPLVAADRVFVATESDEIQALSRKDGKELWSYKRDAPEGFSIAGRAGLILADGKLVTGFTDGAVVAFDPLTGKVLWERDTSVEVDQPVGSPERFVDIDTTPVHVDDLLYVGSFSGGVFAIELSGGGIRWQQNEWTGVTHIERQGDQMVLSSADHGLLMIDLLSKKLLWKRAIQRGAAGHPAVLGERILVGETGGALLAVAAQDGRELTRVESGFGFSAPIAVASARAYVLSNGGRLFALSL